MATPTTNKSKKKPLNIRERKFVKSIIEGKSAAQAMRDAGYSERMATWKGSKKVQESHIQETLQELMDMIYGSTNP